MGSREHSRNSKQLRGGMIKSSILDKGRNLQNIKVDF